MVAGLVLTGCSTPEEKPTPEETPTVTVLEDASASADNAAALANAFYSGLANQDLATAKSNLVKFHSLDQTLSVEERLAEAQALDVNSSLIWHGTGATAEEKLKATGDLLSEYVRIIEEKRFEGLTVHSEAVVMDETTKTAFVDGNLVSGFLEETPVEGAEPNPILFMVFEDGWKLDIEKTFGIQ
jgi:hypothetical protein